MNKRTEKKANAAQNEEKGGMAPPPGAADLEEVYGPTPEVVGVVDPALDGQEESVTFIVDPPGDPKDHWLNDPQCPPPMGSKLGTENAVYAERTGKLRAAARYAFLKGNSDPDAFIEDLVIGLHGYATPTGDKAEAE